VLCFEGATLAELARQAPQVPRVRNCERAPADPERWLARQRGLSAACFDRRVLSPALVAACHRRGLMVFAWTANDPAALRRLRALEVDGVLSDRPAWLVEQVRGR
jgi:glycerophosphoryl diester phosphodiesterase